WIVKPAKGDFVGRDAIEKVRVPGPRRKLIGLEMADRSVARHGYAVTTPVASPTVGREGAPTANTIGIVTSGSYGPSVERSIAMAQDQLGDVVFVELPKVGAKVTAHQAFGVVESVKAVSDLFAPVSGEVLEINAELPQKPETVNKDPYGKGWMILVKPSNAGELDQLLTAQQYEEL